MKTKIVVVVGLLLLSGFTAIGVGDKAIVSTVTEAVHFNEPIVTDSETFVDVTVNGANACLSHAGKPILPLYTTTMTFSFGTKIIDIECKPSEVKNMVLLKKIRPGSKPVAQGLKTSIFEDYMEQNIYGSDRLFPENWFAFYTGGGLDKNNEHKTFLTLRIYPVRYSPATDTIYFVDTFELRITYEEPLTNPFPMTATNDLVIIAPSKFSGALQKLVDHKNDHGLSTELKTLEEIYSEYEGVDEPEQIKYFIKDAKETDNITYVLLVGGLKSYIYAKPRDDQNKGVSGWHLPVRYTNVVDSGGTYDPGYISDLYYADIYDGEGNFSSWDSNGDGIFAEWVGSSPSDIIDLYPDVHLGRLACRNRFEVMIVVNKIIQYESTPADPEWYQKMILAAGDTHDDSGTNYLEGEEMTEYILERYMTDVDPVKLYASNKDIDPDHTPTGTNLIREISAGAGHLFLTGHANPAVWTTHWPGEFEGPDSWTERFIITDFPKLSNRKKLPVCIVEGCHNNQFNVSLIASMMDKDNSKHMWTYGQKVPGCWGWWLTRKIGGGSIATLGHTGLSYEATGERGDLDGDGDNQPDCLEAFCGYQNRMYYKTISEGADILGEAWSGTHQKYLETFPGMDYKLDAKTVQQWALLGDPSLMLGGYSK